MRACSINHTNVPHVSSFRLCLSFSRDQDGKEGDPDSAAGDQEPQLPPAAPVGRGGHWRPAGCRARQKVALLIPFRKRHEHLAVFTRYMHSFLQRQFLDYTIFVIEQVCG